jgi:hypothetical protein
MAKRIEIELRDGSRHVYQSDIFNGYHRHDLEDGFCITKKPLFGQEKPVACYQKSQVAGTTQERCGFCEDFNPTQTSDYK